MTSMDVDIVLSYPGQARCGQCGALLCYVLEPSCVHIKCRRCHHMIRVRLPHRTLSQERQRKDERG